jgi:hypothetical protein
MGIGYLTCHFTDFPDASNARGTAANGRTDWASKARLDTFDMDQCQPRSDRQSLFWGESGDKVDHFAYAKHLRGLAEEFRRMAKKITEEHTRNSFLELAVCYDALANNEEADRVAQIRSTGRG